MSLIPLSWTARRWLGPVVDLQSIVKQQSLSTLEMLELQDCRKLVQLAPQRARRWLGPVVDLRSTAKRQSPSILGMLELQDCRTLAQLAPPGK